MQEIKVKNTEVLLKYLNCLERVFFIENKSMKDYKDLKNDTKKDYTGASLYLKKVIDDYFEKNGLSLFKNSLPELEELKKYSEKLDCIVLDYQRKNSFLSDEEETGYFVVVCPKIEKVFHFKAKDISDSNISSLSKASIVDFFYHPDLPRIKIYSRNFNILKDSAQLSDLICMYTNPGDAYKVINSLKVINNKLTWDDLVPDPSYGVQAGNLSFYFVSSIKIKELKRNIENLKQLILICEDFEGKEFIFHITTTLFRSLYNETPEEKVYDVPKYLRSLVFQGFAEDFRHILMAEKISERDFKDDSIISFLRFRKAVKKEDAPFNSENLPPQVQIKDNMLYYLPNLYQYEIIEVAKEFEKGKRLLDYKMLRDYEEFSNICKFHTGWLESYKNKEDFSRFYEKIFVEEENPYGLHREILKDPLAKLIFFSKNKKMIVFCPHCKEYEEMIKTKNMPDICPICKSTVLIKLNDSKDQELFDKNNLDLELKKKLESYNKLSTLFYSYRKYLYYTINATGYSLNTCVKILNELKDKDFLKSEEIFFEKLLKVLETYNKSEGVHAIIYKIVKNEV